MTKCSVEASAYGKCVVKDYQSVHQGMCAREFLLLRECFLVSTICLCVYVWEMGMGKGMWEGGCVSVCELCVCMNVCGMDIDWGWGWGSGWGM